MIENEGRTHVGHVAEIHRYPVKSMQGERLEHVRIGPEGLQGDRRFALIDTETGRVASAKNPRKWGRLLHLRAELSNGVLVVTSGEGFEMRGDRDDLNAELSILLGREVTVRETPPAEPSIEVHWPDEAGLPNGGSESVEELPANSFFDLAPVHLLTTASLRHFRSLTPHTDFDSRRFRPNILIQTLPELTGFVEMDWPGRSLIVGNSHLRVTAPCTRCVMTTLAQPSLAADPQVLRTAVVNNAAAAGVYAVPDHSGEFGVGDPVWLV